MATAPSNAATPAAVRRRHGRGASVGSTSLIAGFRVNATAAVEQVRTCRIYGAERQERDAEVANPSEETVQLCLVDERPRQSGSAITEPDQREVLKHGGPMIVEVARDPDFVYRGPGSYRSGLAQAG